MRKILITGALGQIGSELTVHMREVYGTANVVASGRRTPKGSVVVEDGIFELIDTSDVSQIVNAVKKHKIDTIVHLSAILSAVGESDPVKAWDVNVGSLLKVLEIAREYNCSVFTPSSIAVFGVGYQKMKTPQDEYQRPTTMYGVTKSSGELLCDYYSKRFGVDTRGVRFPGLISNVTLPGGGTTDYAVHIYYEAIKNKKYSSFINKGTYMDMMYMPDALDAIVNLIEADPAKLIHRNAFNVTAMSFAPEHVADEIKKHIPEFEIVYDVDPVKQAIAESWPDSLDDTAAREEWDWNPKYNLQTMTSDMLSKLRAKLKNE
ncbi:MAG: NAD-dependent epimerase/dehydratase family protein [Clostridiales bacterium]|nr:NAD-dependent epimerase/dehydratase family protein [Clostridiales bacterium]